MGLGGSAHVMELAVGREGKVLGGTVRTDPQKPGLVHRGVPVWGHWQFGHLFLWGGRHLPAATKTLPLTKEWTLPLEK